MKMLVFGADWCPACKALKPVLSRVMADFPRVEVRHLDIDIPEDQDEARGLNIRAIPVTIVLEGDNEIARMVGSGGEDEIRSFVSTYVKNETLPLE